MHTDGVPARRRSQPRLRRSAATLLFVAAMCALCTVSRPAYAQDGEAFRHWVVSVDGAWGKPSGHVQVRENQIEGTRLRFGPDLGIGDMSWESLWLQYRFDPDRSMQLILQNYTLTGSKLLPQNVNFNGATLAAGTVLSTVTRFPEFLRATAFYQGTLSHKAGGGILSGRVGLTFEALNFKLRGTLAPDSVGREMKEDFITQELPIPMFGLAWSRPLGNRLRLDASLDAAWLPWVNSLRSEGGEVKLAQTNVDLHVGVDYALTGNLDLTVGYDSGYFKQAERSHEDGNRILLKSSAARLGLAYRF